MPVAEPAGSSAGELLDAVDDTTGSSGTGASPLI
jgi:hypothetical protein